LGPLPTVLRLVSRIVFLPILAGLAYEYIRWMANHLQWGWVKLLIQPNLALQRLTTRQPSLDMIEVSIAAFNQMIAIESTETQEAQQQLIMAANQPVPR
jgi:uncharacterized protein YqhQ